MSHHVAVLAAVVFGLTALAAAQPDTRVWPAGAPADPRLKARTLREGSGFTPPASKEQWIARAKSLREQVLMAAGLWPMPAKAPLNAVIHGKIDREDYTVEKVYFESWPGFHVTGSLYRPKGKPGPLPVVLSPHGHWDKGRFHEAKPADVKKQIEAGQEKDELAARFPLQARCANLAKLGCIVFHYDMVGYADADTDGFPHRAIYRDVDSDQRSIGVFGLQTWNSIRAMDFVLSLPDVDKERVACTGASGGGTQTFVMMAIDDRLKVAAPVCMISAGDHQGGCVCENSSMLRIFTDNVEISAAFAPRPFIHPTATGDWTAHYLEQGFPETKAVYKLFGAEGMVESMRQEAGHNYNMRGREAVYTFFNTHLKLGHAGPVTEKAFVPVPPKELSVFDADHPRPANAVDQAGLKKLIVAESSRQMDALRAQSLAAYKQAVGTALRHMLATDLPSADGIVIRPAGEVTGLPWKVEKLILSRQGSAEQVPALLFTPANATGPATVVIHPQGKSAALGQGGAAEVVAGLLGRGQTVLVPDVHLTGELRPAAMPTSLPKVEFYAGYNRTTIANRAHDILTAVACLKTKTNAASVHLIGLENAGPWCLLARSLAGDSVIRLAADAAGFDFDKVQSIHDENYLPGSLKFGGLWGLAAVGAPGQLMMWNTGRDQTPAALLSAYSAANAADKLRVETKAAAEQIIGWIGR